MFYRFINAINTHLRSPSVRNVKTEMCSCPYRDTPLWYRETQICCGCLCCCCTQHATAVLIVILSSPLLFYLTFVGTLGTKQRNATSRNVLNHHTTYYMMIHIIIHTCVHVFARYAAMVLEHNLTTLTPRFRWRVSLSNSHKGFLEALRVVLVVLLDQYRVYHPR